MENQGIFAEYNIPSGMIVLGTSETLRQAKTGSPMEPIALLSVIDARELARQLLQAADAAAAAVYPPTGIQ
jgi:hypothetical protein